MNSLVRLKAQCVAAFLLVSMVGCGCEPDYAPPAQFADTRAMSDAFNGEWVGAAAVSVFYADGAHASDAFNVAVHAEVHGPELDVTVTPVCGETSLVMTTTGNGAQAMWYGDVTCPPPSPYCPDAVVRYTSSVLKVLSDGRLYILLHGTLTGCAESHPIAVEVYGTH